MKRVFLFACLLLLMLAACGGEKEDKKEKITQANLDDAKNAVQAIITNNDSEMSKYFAADCLEVARQQASNFGDSRIENITCQEKSSAVGCVAVVKFMPFVVSDVNWDLVQPLEFGFDFDVKDGKLCFKDGAVSG